MYSIPQIGKTNFSIFDNSDMAYFDNAATMQKPDIVLEETSRFYRSKNANPHRGLYELSEECTKEYENCRQVVAEFINASDSSEIIFTKNATEGINLIAYTWPLTLKDEILVTVAEHHSNMLPWFGRAKVIQLPINEDGVVDPEVLRKNITPNTKILAINHVSNVLGSINDIKTLAQICHENNVIIVVDATQSVPHMDVNVRDLDVDFMVFSGHKMMAETGIGVLYGKKNLLNKLNPFIKGGNMVDLVHWDLVKFSEIPYRFEAGTPNVGGGISLRTAIEYIKSIGFNRIQNEEKSLIRSIFFNIKDIPHLHILGSENPENHCGIITFNIDDVHPHDAADLLAGDNICVRAGYHCAQPLFDFLGVDGGVRISVSFYNTAEDVNRLLESIRTIRSRMGYDQ